MYYTICKSSIIGQVPVLQYVQIIIDFFLLSVSQIMLHNIVCIIGQVLLAYVTKFAKRGLPHTLNLPTLVGFPMQKFDFFKIIC